MHPVLFTLGPVAVPSYAVFLLMAFGVAYVVRRIEIRRLGSTLEKGNRQVGLGALVGAVLGSKLGMVLFLPWTDLGDLFRSMLSLDFTGKTVVGGIAGGFLGVLVTRRRLGIRHRTGDAFALALPLAQAVGRVGCLLHGCCYVAETEVPWAVSEGGVMRHPVQLYEVGLDLVLAGILFILRTRPLPPGHLFRVFLIGYAAIRLFLDPYRGDPVQQWGPLSAVQWVCVAAIVGFGAEILRSRLRP